MVVQVPKAQWELLVLRVLLVCWAQMAHQDLREALDSLGSRVKGEMLVFLDLKERLDLKENLVLQEHRE